MLADRQATPGIVGYIFGFVSTTQWGVNIPVADGPLWPDRIWKAVGAARTVAHHHGPEHSYAVALRHIVACQLYSRSLRSGRNRTMVP